jgi:glycosyltransferase involved in cell wall biosynthesis
MFNMPANELASVIVPTFNRGYCIQRAIDSVLAQTYPNIEVLVVDDGSTDKTSEVVRDRYGDDSIVRYHYQDNKGVSSARNRGIGLARGAYVAFLDSDDTWKPWKLDLQIRCISLIPQVGMIWSEMEAVGPDGRLVSDRYLRTMYGAYALLGGRKLFSDGRPLLGLFPDLPAEARGGTLYAGDIFRQMVMGNLVHTSTVLLRRERMLRVRGFNEELRVSGEDYDFHLRTCREGPVAFIDVSTVRYQIGMPDALTRPEYSIHLALNDLKTITPIIELDGARIGWPSSVLRRRLARSNAWVGESYSEMGQLVEARPFLIASIGYHFWQPRVWLLTILSFLPASVAAGCRSGYRRVKTWVFGSR